MKMRDITMTPSKILAENTKMVAKQLRMNLGEIEKQSGLSVGYLSRVNRGEKASIGLDYAVRISEIIGVPIEKLVNRDYADSMRKTMISRRLEDLEVERAELLSEYEKLGGEA